MQNHYTRAEPGDETPDRFRLTQLAVMNGGLVNRPVLQALPLADLMELAHLMAQTRPARFTPDLAWKWLRMVIEPMEWEVTAEAWATGDHYVAFWGGVPVACQPRTANGYTKICATMREFFDGRYPKQLVSDRWTTHHIPLLEASHVN